MAKTIKEERLRWILPIVKGEARLVDVARVCPHSQRSLERWVAAYRRGGTEALEPRSTAPKTQPDETPIWIKERVIALRTKKRRCALKIHWQLEREGILLHPRTVGKILKREGLVRIYRIRKIKYQYVRAERLPGELVEIDVKYVPGRIAGKRYFQYTAIDCASRWRYLEIFEEYGTHESIEFLKHVMVRFPHTIRAIKTDNGSPFTNYYLGTNKRSDQTVKTLHAMDRFCTEHGIVHYLIDPGKPAQNGTVERSHRSDQESFYDRNRFFSVSDLRRKIRLWNTEYNNLAHCGLQGKTPNEYMVDHPQANPPNVRT